MKWLTPQKIFQILLNSFVYFHFKHNRFTIQLLITICKQYCFIAILPILIHWEPRCLTINFNLDCLVSSGHSSHIPSLSSVHQDQSYVCFIETQNARYSIVAQCFYNLNAGDRTLHTDLHRTSWLNLYGKGV